MNTKEIHDVIILGIKDYFAKNKFGRAVIGLSGGLDSSVAACLTVRALGSGNVTGLLMPNVGVTSMRSIKDAKALAKKLKISNFLFPINAALEGLKNNNAFSDDQTLVSSKARQIAVANLAARARMVALYYHANLSYALVIGTSDKSEIALGYTTKYGDSAADILVIGDLWKSEVLELGRYLKIPDPILKKMPSAELIFGQDAKKELGADYLVLDNVLKMRIEDGKSFDDILKRGFDKKIVQSVFERIRLNEHKRRYAMIIRLSEKSFHGSEWRMPVTNNFRG